MTDISIQALAYKYTLRHIYVRHILKSNNKGRTRKFSVGNKLEKLMKFFEFFFFQKLPNKECEAWHIRRPG